MYAHLADGGGSLDQCIELYEQAANGGVADAQNALGIIFEDMMPSRPKQAQAWFKMAADDGHAAAAYNLGLKARAAARPHGMHFVDMRLEGVCMAGGRAGSCCADRLHPTPLGSERLASAWLAPLSSAVDDVLRRR